MIIRVARAKISEGRLEEFRKHIARVWIPQARSQEGVIGFYPGMNYAFQEFVMVSLWDDVASLEAVFGQHWDKVLTDMEELPLIEEVHVRHYEVFGHA